MWWAALHVQRWPFNLGTCIPSPPAPGLPRLHHPHACGVSGQWEMRPARPRASALLAPSSPAPHTTCRLPVVEESLGPPCCTATAPTFLLQHPSILREVLTLSKPPGTTRSHSRAVTVLPGAGPPPPGLPVCVAVKLPSCSRCWCLAVPPAPSGLRVPPSPGTCRRCSEHLLSHPWDKSGIAWWLLGGCCTATCRGVPLGTTQKGPGTTRPDSPARFLPNDVSGRRDTHHTMASLGMVNMRAGS